MDIKAVREAMDSVARLISSHRYAFGDEKALQAVMAQLFERHGVVFEREKPLLGGPIDFFLTESSIGIEVKVQGSPSKVSEQLLRYANCPELNGILLVTSKSSVAKFIPPFLAGKPSGVVNLLGQAF